MKQLTKNTGLLLGQRPEDYIFGATSPIVHEVRNALDDWKLFRSRNERQNLNPGNDRMHCVSASATNIWEQQANWMAVNNLWPADALKFWNDNAFIVNGKFEICRRFTAKMSGTTRAGNYFFKVWDSIRKDGVIPDSKWPDDPTYDWDEYYKEIPQDLILLGKESLKYFNLLYESMQGASIAQMKFALDMCPLHIGVTTQCGWDDEVPMCGLPSNHAVDNDNIRADGSVEIFDSYDPYTKHLAKGYPILACYRAVLYPIKRAEPVLPPPAPAVPYAPPFTYDLKQGDDNQAVAKLQQILRSIPVVNNDAIGYYGSGTVRAVQQLMIRNNIGSWWEKYISPAGRRVGLKIRNYLNNLK